MGEQKVPDPLSLACERVGRFLYYCSRVEMQLDEAITKIFKLDPQPALIITASIDFNRKVNIVQCAVAYLNENSPSEKKIEMDTFKNVRVINDKRQIIAHSSFEPDGSDAVQFRRSTAREEYKQIDPRWTEQQFEQRYQKLQELEAELGKIVSKIEGERFLLDALTKPSPWPSQLHPAYLGFDSGGGLLGAVLGITPETK